MTKAAALQGYKVREGDFRCDDCMDTCNYLRPGNEGDAAENCTYCHQPVWVPAATVAPAAETVEDVSTLEGIEIPSTATVTRSIKGPARGHKTDAEGFRGWIARAESHEYDLEYRVVSKGGKVVRIGSKIQGADTYTTWYGIQS